MTNTAASIPTAPTTTPVINSIIPLALLSLGALESHQSLKLRSLFILKHGGYWPEPLRVPAVNYAKQTVEQAQRSHPITAVLFAYLHRGMGRQRLVAWDSIRNQGGQRWAIEL